MAVSSPPRRARAKNPWVRVVLWGMPILLVLLLIAIFVVKSMLESYLRSDSFRQMVSKKAGDTLHADANLAALHFSGSEIFADGFEAQGGPDAAFAKLQIEQIRTEISLRRFFEHVWQVEQFDVQRVRFDLEGPRANRPVEPTLNPLAAPKTENHDNGWIPNRVEVGRAIIHDTQLNWKDGGLRGTAFDLQPHEGGWQIAGQGGRLEYGKLPPLDVANLQFRYRAPSLFINSAELRQPGGGSLQANGEVNFERQLDIQMRLVGIDLSPYLSDDWRMKLKGTLNGEVNVHTSLPKPDPAGPQLTGTLKMTQGELTALPVLDEIATFTRTQQFRRIHLSNASGDFKQEGQRLSVTKFVAESDGLIRIEGDFAIDHGMIDGVFQVGVTPGSLQWLPGSQAKVFTESRGGYVWAPMRLTGPANKPTEDLSPRLIAAAQGAVIEGVQNAADQAVKKGQDALKNGTGVLKNGTDALKSGQDVLKNAFDLLMPPSK